MGAKSKSKRSETADNAEDNTPSDEPEPEPYEEDDDVLLPFTDGLAFKDITKEQIIFFDALTTEEEQQNFICELFDIKYFKENPRSAIFCDFMLNVLLFAIESKFKYQQISIFFSIGKRVFDTSLGFSINRRNKNAPSILSVEESFSYFKSLLLKHSVNMNLETTSCNQIFRLQEVNAIIAFMKANLYRYYKEYSFVFDYEQSIADRVVKVQIETPPEVIEDLENARPLNEAEREMLNRGKSNRAITPIPLGPLPVKTAEVEVEVEVEVEEDKGEQLQLGQTKDFEPISIQLGDDAVQ